MHRSFACLVLYCLGLTCAGGALTALPVLHAADSSADPLPTDPPSSAGVAAPAAPSQLVGVFTDNDEVHLTWLDNSPNEAEFRLENTDELGVFHDFAGVPANDTGVVVTLAPLTSIAFRVRARNASGFSPYSNVVSLTPPPPSGACGSPGIGMCLNQNRFRVLASFRTAQNVAGAAHSVKLTDDSGYLWFFAATNLELVAKLLNGCGLNGRYWLFAAGLTNVEVIVSLRDNQTANSGIYYLFRQGVAFPPLQDTGAFATCP